ncbi:TPA: Cj0814 family flagellar-dependent secreted protein [Campylobacter jejuni]
MSIFSINDSSNYNSILSQSKANKESKENSKISFANAFLKQNASKLSDIESKNSQTLARSEILSNNNALNNSSNSANISNSSNTNLSINTTKTSSPNYDISSEFKNSIYTLKYKQADTSNIVSLAYGYGVDANGYMGSDFNKAAGLPEDFKIHKSTLDEIERFNQHNMASETSGNYYDSFDMASIVKSHYNSFNQVISAFPNDKTSFSEADLEQLPKGLNDGCNQNKEYIVTHIFNAEQFHEAQAIKYSTMNLGMNLMKLDFSPQSMERGPSNEGGFNPDMSVYPQNEDGSYSKEALFMSFLKAQNGQPVESPKTTLNPTIEAYNRAMAKESFSTTSVDIGDIMTGKVDFASLFKYLASKNGKLEGQLYMYENNIPKESAMGNWALDAEIKQAIANGWKAKPSTINSYADSIMDRLNNLIGQTRV